ncbi:MAG: ABC transporter ATP-binding protein [Lachnospiraceae bacterium]|nr:ABC transporter ATP-binding protein [Lachnospiraceae bacterium]
MRLDNVSVGYKKKIIVRDVSIEISKGEIISLIGPNGGGKSTLLKSISGQLSLLGGSVYIGKDDIREIPLKEMSKNLSIVTTERITPQLMTAGDVVLAGRLPYTEGFGLFSENDKKERDKAVKLMKIEPLTGKYFSDMSDGQKQRTLIARAICQTPDILVMDEPTSYLDIRHRMELMDVIKGLAGDGMTIIMSLHELELAMAVSDRLLLIYEDGNTVCETPQNVIKKGLIKDLYDLDDKMYQKVLTYCSIVN